MTAIADTAVPVEPSRFRVVTLLGIGQILAWGTSYYLPAIVAAPIAQETGWPMAAIVGGLSWAMLIAGLISPRIGKAIDQHGGRPVLAASSVLLSFGIGLLGLSTGLPVYYLAWTLIGLGMGSGLYDAAFATLGRYYGAGARPAITGLTLFGGFASTLCWPVVAALVGWLDWRGACFVIAATHLAVGLPINGLLLPSATSGTGPGTSRPVAAKTGDPEPTPAGNGLFFLLATGFTVFAALAAGMSVHILDVLRRLQVDPALTVAFGMIIGPAQVGARLVEFAIGQRTHPIWTARTGILLCLAGMVGLVVAGPLGITAAIIAAIAAYGAGNGIMTIARGALPLALFGPQGYGQRVGRLARPVLIVQAATPPLIALVMDGWGPVAVLSVACGLALVSTLVFATIRPPTS